jgi:hypothetical protein
MEQITAKKNRLALCANDRCKSNKFCMRYKLEGNAQFDTWVEFKPVMHHRISMCKHFIHFNSENAIKYINDNYRGITGGTYE